MRMAAALAAVMVFVGGSNARAQPPGQDFNSTAAGLAGAGRTWDDEGQLGNGAVLGIRVDRRLFGNTFAEVSLDSLRHERTGRFSASGRTLLVSASLVQRFGRGHTQPYLLGGVALARHRGTFGFPEDDLQFDARSTDTGFALGGGVAVRVARRFEIGPEARLLTFASDNDSSPAFAYWVGVRVGVRF